MQSTLLEAGSCSTKLSCTGELMKILDWDFVTSLVDLESFLPLSEDNVEGAVALLMLKAPLSSTLSLPLAVEACLLGGGDIDLSLDDWNAS